MKRLIGVAMSLAVLATAVWAFAPRPLPPFAATTLRPDGLQVNGIARAGERLVAVGERGQILFSDDQGRNWRTAVVDHPQGAALTQVVFADSRHGMAVGHSGWILRTEDGGAHWQQVAFDARSSDPLLGAWAQAGGPWFAVGSFGRFLVSRDQGRHWEAAADKAMQDRHLNGIAGDGQGRLMLVGEAGLVLRSPDGGSRWEVVKSPTRVRCTACSRCATAPGWLSACAATPCAARTSAPPGRPRTLASRPRSSAASSCPMAASCWPGRVARW